MKAPIWIIVYGRNGEQEIIVRCSHSSEADDTIFHNQYYKRRCLKIGIKEWK